jgi:4-hydroxy-3-polyprenylbenzoate decarboxylase
MPRETPMHIGHCELVYKAAQLGATIAPPVTAFYNRPSSIDDIINHSVGRVIDLFGFDCGKLRRWNGPHQANAGEENNQAYIASAS